MAGRLVSRARARAGMTQQELAEAAGMTQSVVSAYETGRRQPSLPTLCKLVAAAGFEPRIGLRPARPSDGRRSPADVGSRAADVQGGTSDVRERAGVASPVSAENLGPVGSRLAANRDLARAIIERHGAERPRVFGSVARGEDQEGSDLDIIVRAPAGFTLLDQAAILVELRDLLGVDVDVVTEGALDEEAARHVDAQAVPL